MSRSPFVVPEGVQLELSGEDLILRYDGDVVLESGMGYRLGGVESGGDLIVRLDGEVGTLTAQGRVVAEGDVEASHIHGRFVILGGEGMVKAKAISATHAIQLGPAQYAVDVIIAPRILIDPDASGRVTVIESFNDRGVSKIKGGFSLDEYEELFGNSSDFLAERGLERLGEPPPEEELAIPVEVSADALPVMTYPEEEEDIEDPLSLSIEDLEPVELEDDDLHPQLVDALQRITSCYENSEVPPAVDQLRMLVNGRDYNKLRGNITDVWNGLLSFHQQRGIRPHHQVTHAFNVIHGLVQQM